MRMLRRPRRARCNRLNRDRKTRRNGNSHSPLHRKRQQGVQTLVEDAGEAEAVEAGEVVELNQLGLPDKRKQARR